MKVIDAHHHLWQLDQFDYSWMNPPELEPLRRDRLPGDLKPLLDAAGVDATIVVQTQHNLAENRWALKLAEQHEFLAGVVGWVDLASPACEDQLAEFMHHPKFRGVRHVTQDEPDDDFIIRPDILRGLKVLEKHRVPFDLLFYVKHLRHAVTLGRLLPELPMVIDHLAKPRIDPRISPRAMDDWLPHFRAAAACSNIYCKLSGMITEADWHNWKPADLRPYVMAALENFGPERCMFGSDWPVCTLAGTYQQAVEALREALGPISDTERDAIWGGTAMRFYGIKN